MNREYETAQVEDRGDGLLLLTLNRPQAANAMNTQMGRDLLAFFDTVNAAPGEQRCVIVTGAGERAFCTGGDVSGTGGDAEHRRRVNTSPLGHGREMRDGMQAVLALLKRIDKPSVAMIQGYAVAGGLALALACDFRFAGPDAKLGDTSGRFGLLPDEGGAWLFPHVMGYDRALKMTLLHEIYPAPEAYRLGLLTELVEGDLEARTLAFAEALAAQAPLAVRMVKTMMTRALEGSFESSLGDAQLAVMITNPSADVREGGAAFREKRAPRFEGR